MSLIKDISRDIGELDLSNRSLRKFGYSTGTIAAVIGILLTLFHNGDGGLKIICFSLGGLLILIGLMAPNWLRWIYIFWMTMAFVAGWFISRIILIFLFYLVMTPIGMTARFFRKKFLDISFHDGKKSYWMAKKKREVPDYEKLY